MKTIPTTYPNRPGFFPISIPYKEYRLRRVPIRGVDEFIKVEKKRNKQFEKTKKRNQGKVLSETHSKKLNAKEEEELQDIEILPNEEFQKSKKQIIKEQAKGRKKHFEMQTPDVQKRMKQSEIESEKLRHKRSFFERVKFWIRNCIKW